MAILTKSQLSASNATSFPDNNSGLITPALLRNYNTSSIDSYAALSGSNTYVGNQVISGSLTISGSFSYSSLATNQTETYSGLTGVMDNLVSKTTGSFNLISGSFTKILSISASSPGAALNMDTWFQLTGSGEIGYQSYGGYLRPNDLSNIVSMGAGNASSQNNINPIFSASWNSGTGYVDVYARNNYSGATTSVIIAMKVASPNPITIA
jgi:hypothetical protein